MIKLKPDQWNTIHARLMAEYPPSVMLLRYKMREVLGFTVREHHQWVKAGTDKNGRDYGKYEDCICLDFYNDAMESWFQLKYM